MFGLNWFLIGLSLIWFFIGFGSIWFELVWNCFWFSWFLICFGLFWSGLVRFVAGLCLFAGRLLSYNLCREIGRLSSPPHMGSKQYREFD